MTGNSRYLGGIRRHLEFLSKESMRIPGVFIIRYIFSINTQIQAHFNTTQIYRHENNKLFSQMILLFSSGNFIPQLNS